MNCKNCNKELTAEARYCPNCGQRNIEKLSLRYILKEVVDNIFEIDSKLFKTLKHLLFKPGLLSKTYMQGKRVSFVPPVRLYLVLSVIFFFLISVIDVKTDPTVNNNEANALNQENSFVLSNDGIKKIDSTDAAEGSFSFNGETIGELVTEAEGREMDIDGTLDHYLDSVTKGKGFQGYFDKQATKANVRGDSFDDLLLNQISLFLLLFIPLLALLYATCFSRNNYGYIGHLIFNLHFNSFVILLLCVDQLLGLIILPDTLDTIWNLIMVFLPQVYLILAIMKFYDRKWWSALYKYFLLFIGYVVLAFVFFIVVIISSMIMT